MNDDLHKPVTAKVDSVEDQAKYLLKKRKAIVRTLKLLLKSKSLISAYFASDRNPLLTLILEVLPDKDLVILDYGPDESTNRKVLEAKQLNVMTQYEGIKARFSSKSVIKAKFKGQPVFAIPIPDSVFWLQRREYYRVKVPMSEPVRCEIRLAEGRAVTYPVIDISVGGIAIRDMEFDFTEATAPVGHIFEDCQLIFPASGEEPVRLHVRNHVLLNKTNRGEGQRVGLSFEKLGYAADAKIQQYMQMIDLQRRRVAAE